MSQEQATLADMPAVGNQHKTLSETVFDVLGNAILSRAMREGEHLSEAILAERMGISRAPVREALAELAKHGLVVQVPRKGTFVRAWAKEDLLEIATLRSVLEGLAARLASPALTCADVDYLERVIERMETADREGDASQLIDLDLMFHARVWQCANHRLLRGVLEELKLQTKLFMSVTRLSDATTLAKMHKALLEALRSQDPDCAQEAAIEHVSQSASLALQGVSDDELRLKLGSRKGGVFGSLSAAHP